MPSAKDYGDMHANERSEDDDKKAIDKYLNAELILNMGTHDERRGRRIKRTRGLDGEPIGCTLANPLLTPMSTINAQAIPGKYNSRKEQVCSSQ
jgi:hypothetical protein